MLPFFKAVADLFDLKLSMNLVLMSERQLIILVPNGYMITDFPLLVAGASFQYISCLGLCKLDMFGMCKRMLNVKARF